MKTMWWKKATGGSPWHKACGAGNLSLAWTVIVRARNYNKGQESKYIAEDLK